MPASVPITIAVLASVLILVALVGGDIRFGPVSVHGKASTGLRTVTGVLGIVLMFVAVDLSRPGTPDTASTDGVPASTGVPGTEVATREDAPKREPPRKPIATNALRRSADAGAPIPLMWHPSAASTTATSSLTGIRVMRDLDVDVRYPAATGSDALYQGAVRTCSQFAGARERTVDSMEVIVWLPQRQGLMHFQKIAWEIETRGFRRRDTANDYVRRLERVGDDGRDVLGVISLDEDGEDATVTWVGCLLR